jgi:hypothetical protein
MLHIATQLTRLAILCVVKLSLVANRGGYEVLGIFRVVAPVVTSFQRHVAFGLGAKLLLAVTKRLRDLGQGTAFRIAGGPDDGRVRSRTAGGSRGRRVDLCTIGGFVYCDNVGSAGFGRKRRGLQGDRAVRTLG